MEYLADYLKKLILFLSIDFRSQINLKNDTYNIFPHTFKAGLHIYKFIACIQIVIVIIQISY